MSSVDLPLESELRFGIIGSFTGVEGARAAVELAEAGGYDSLWVGDHIAFPMPILDPLLVLSALAALNSRLMLGTAVYLLPLRHPVPVAKQVATLDHLVGGAGRLILGVGVGGEFPGEYAACGVPVRERGARLSEAIPLLKQLLTGETVSSAGQFYPIPETRLLPAPKQKGGPPVWCGGRSDPALRRAGALADGWVSYVVTPEQFRAGLETIAAAAATVGRVHESFGTGHLLFMRIDDEYDSALDAATEHLSQRYAMDFRKAAKRYAALGRPADVAARIAELREAGVRHFILDCTGPIQDRDAQLERFAREVRPLL